ncbi:MAG: hypothetical protein A2W23_02695 [Planctomycetes bacterium RBG_16_43_13]|nr:MAG: hypothetical protein A2W23_02695 [Planctomycetes bacterium RBG_16_43_13]
MKRTVVILIAVATVSLVGYLSFNEMTYQKVGDSLNKNEDSITTVTNKTSSDANHPAKEQTKINDIDKEGLKKHYNRYLLSRFDELAKQTRRDFETKGYTAPETLYQMELIVEMANSEMLAQLVSRMETENNDNLKGCLIFMLGRRKEDIVLESLVKIALHNDSFTRRAIDAIAFPPYGYYTKENATRRMARWVGLGYAENRGDIVDNLFMVSRGQQTMDEIAPIKDKRVFKSLITILDNKTDEIIKRKIIETMRLRSFLNEKMDEDVYHTFVNELYNTSNSMEIKLELLQGIINSNRENAVTEIERFIRGANSEEAAYEASSLLLKHKKANIDDIYSYRNWSPSYKEKIREKLSHQ